MGAACGGEPPGLHHSGRVSRLPLRMAFPGVSCQCAQFCCKAGDFSQISGSACFWGMSHRCRKGAPTHYCSPLPTSTKGAQTLGCAKRPPLAMRAASALRSASARPIFGFGLHGVDRAGSNGDGRLRIHIPMRDQQRPRPGIEERARQPRQRLGALAPIRRPCCRPTSPPNRR